MMVRLNLSWASPGGKERFLTQVLSLGLDFLGWMIGLKGAWTRYQGASARGGGSENFLLQLLEFPKLPL